MTHIVPISLPIRFQAIRVPVQWKCEMTSEPWIKTLPPDDNDKFLFYAEAVEGAARTYDPWELRDEFIRLRPAHGPKLLLQFLDKVGMFDKPELEDADENPHILGGGYSVKVGVIRHDFRSQARRDYGHFWDMQHSLVRAMRSRTSGIFDAPELPLRFRRGRRECYAEITATTFMDAVITTIEIRSSSRSQVPEMCPPRLRDCFFSYGSPVAQVLPVVLRSSGVSSEATTE